jgi:endonuclease YncB( thermonuclease family)
MGRSRRWHRTRRRNGRRGAVRCTIVQAWLVCLSLSVAARADDPLIGRVDHVADGDTLTVTADDGRHRIRLHEIDTPEHDQPWSREAREALSSKVGGKYVRVDVEALDDYGRTVGKVWLGERDINRELVREGHAWVYRKYLDDESLLADEAAARRARRGLWSLAAPIAPWRWRHSVRAATNAGDPVDPNCEIKGNISRRGDRIYHRPGDRSYRDTRIDTSRGERWFCSVDAAERAGWRRAR